MGFALSDLQVTSSAFGQDAAIPARHTGEGENRSPELAWTGVPDGTRSLAVFCHDPDAPLISARGTYGFVHWILYNIPPAVNRLPEGVAEYTAGNNDFGKIGYGGPLPPAGHGAHRYYFWVLALNQPPEFAPELTLWAFLEQAEPMVTAMNRLVGTFRRG